uniref:Chlorophyll a-b binding protein, chloroplastic n=1 Tax=Anthurium amnicola TaxID=1678845 RepID=A0A1D1YP34_9ARAE
MRKQPETPPANGSPRPDCPQALGHHLFFFNPFCTPTTLPSTPRQGSLSLSLRHSLVQASRRSRETNVGMASSAAKMCCAAAVPGLLSSSRSKFAGAALPLPSVYAASACSRFTMSAEWMPGQPRPPYLDGSAPGDFGFDPLRLGEVPENLERFKESELIHCRWAMLAVVSSRQLDMWMK